MSHFSVAVITKPGQNLDDLLAPFDEGLAVTPYIDRTKEQLIVDAKERLKRYEEEPDPAKKYEMCTDSMKVLLLAKTDDDFHRAEVDYWEYKIDAEGNALTTYNPKSKWDWYVVGGRWASELPVVEGAEYVAQETALVKDVNFGVDPVKYEKYKRYYEVVVDGSPLKPGENKEDYFSFYRPEFLKERYGDADNYARLNSMFSAFAIVTSDGTWYEKGHMGWFGLSTETHEEAQSWDENFEEFVKSHSDPNDWLTIVDCHI